MISFRAPGKLFVAGEYAVLQPGQPAVLVAVDRYATVTVAETAETRGPILLTSDLAGGISERCDRAGGRVVSPDSPPGGPFAHVLAAVNVVERLAAEQGHPALTYRLQVGTDLWSADGRKLGLGSSAAVTVATCGALARRYGLRLSRMDLYRLAMLAILSVGPSASGADVAASTFGGWLLYGSPDRDRLVGPANGGSVTAALGARWSGLTVCRLPDPGRACLEVGWTGQPATTSNHVERLYGTRSRGCRPGSDPCADWYQAFLEDSADCVSSLVTWLRYGDIERVQQQVRRAREVLGGLDSLLSLGWMTPRLRALCTTAEAFGVAAKPSGAGGGDCGIALIRPDQQARVPALRDQWIRGGIVPLGLRPHYANEEEMT